MVTDFHPDMKYHICKICDENWNLFSDLPLDVYDLTFVLEGSAVYYVDNIEYTVKEGQAIFVKQGQFRRAHTEFMRCAAFSFITPHSFDLTESNIVDWMNDPLVKSYITNFNLEWIQKSSEYMLKCTAVFMLIVHRIILLNQKHAENPSAEKMKRYIAENCTQPLTVSEVSKFMNLNVVYCGALFKKHTGETILEYVNRLRINYAEELIKSGEFSITQIAEQVGYKDVYCFSKAFKRLRGFPPSALKN